MFFKIHLLFLIIVSALYCSVSGEPPATKKQYFLGSTAYKCNGKDAQNYTHITTYSRDQCCTPATEQSINDDLVQCDGNGQTAVSVLLQLSASSYPAGGGMSRDDILYLATSGPLEGKYIYEKVVYLDELHLKKCSSVLGVSYVAVSSQSATLLISDTLDANIFLYPAGAYEGFRKGCTTVCYGDAYYI